MANRTLDLGVITAYGDARDAGYQGTKQEFGEALKKAAEFALDIDTIITEAMHFIGVTTTALFDGSTANPIVIGGNNVTAKSGDIAIYSELEFIFSDTDNKWREFGSTGSLKALAFKDNASGSYTPSGTVSQPTFTGTPGTVSIYHYGINGDMVEVDPDYWDPNYTPSGSVTVTPTVTLNTTTVNSITNVGTLPVLTTAVENENLTFSFSQGTLPTKGANTTVATGIRSATAIGSFSGNSVGLRIPTREEFLEGTFTPQGTVTQPTFTGIQGIITVS